MVLLHLPAGTGLAIQNSKLYNNSAGTLGRTISSFESNASIIVDGCLFESNTGLLGGAIALDDSDVFLERCVFKSNHAYFHGGAVYCTDSGILRMSQTNFSDDTAGKRGQDIVCDLLSKGKCKINTYISVFQHQHITVKSSDKYFKEIVLEENMISPHSGKDIILIEETPYASGNPSVSYIQCIWKLHRENNLLIIITLKKCYMPFFFNIL